MALLEPEEQARVRAFVINKFRGDPAILEPGLRQLESLLHKPVLGVLPHWDVAIDEEDSLTERFSRATSKDAAVAPAPRIHTDSKLDNPASRKLRIAPSTSVL